MGRFTTVRRLLMSSALLLAPLAEFAQAADLADRTPEGATVFIGWSDLLKPFALDTVDPQAVVKMMSDRFDMPNTDKEPLGRLIESVITGLNGSGGFSIFLRPGEGGLDVQFAVLVDAGEKNALLQQHLNIIMPAIAEKTAATVTLDGTTFLTVPLNQPVYWTHQKNTIILACGEDAAKRVAATLKGSSKPLSENAEFKLMRSKTAPGAKSYTFCLFADLTQVRIGQMLAMLDGGPGAKPTPEVQKAFDALAIDSFRSFYWQVEPTEYGSRSRAMLRVEGPDRGLVKLLRQKPLTDGDLQLISRDAYWGTAFNFDLNAAWLEAREVMTAVDPNVLVTVDGGLAMAQSMLSFSPTEHLLPALGDTWVLYDAPSHGGLLFTGAVLAAEVRDAAAVDGIIKRVIELAAPLAMQGQVTLKTNSYQHAGHTIQYVVIGGVPAPVAPAWTMVGDRVLFGLTPQTVAAALPQMDAKTRKSSILDHPDYKAMRAGLPKEVTGFSCGDSAYFTRQVYPLLLHALIAGHSFMVPYMPGDIAALPAVEDKVKSARLSMTVASVTPDGIYQESVGPGDLLSATGGSVAATALGVSVLLPSLSRARDQAKMAVSMSNLKNLGMAVHIYAADHSDKLPASLDELIEANILTREVLSSPFDSPGTISYTYVPYGGKRVGQFEQPSETLLAFENDPGDRDEVVVLFLDGHVRRMPVYAAREYVRGAYEKAGAAEQLPEAWR